MMNRLILIVSLISLVFLSSCKAKRQAVATRPKTEASVPKVAAYKDAYSNDAATGKALVKSAKGWLGTPYRYGGQSKSGTDCSGMVMVLFRDVAKVSLPRNSAAQHDYCFEIPKRRLEPGDLVFFRTSKGSSKVSHVGLYIGDGNMIHASSSRGVIISSLDEKYYVNHYHSSGRVYGITYAATGGSKPKGKKNKKRKDEDDNPDDGVMMAEAKAEKRADSAKATDVQGRPARHVGEAVTEMTLDEFLAMQGRETKPVSGQDAALKAERLRTFDDELATAIDEAYDSVVVAEDSLARIRAHVMPEFADSVDMVPGFFDEVPDWPVTPDGMIGLDEHDTQTGLRDAKPAPEVKMTDGKNAKTGQRDLPDSKMPSDSLKESDRIREHVGNAVKSGK